MARGRNLSRPHDSDLQPIWSLAMMSGTSGDGIDAALLLSDGDGITRLGPAAMVPYGPALRERLGRILRRSGWKEPRLTHAKQRNRPGRVAHALTLAHVDAARRLLRRQPDAPPVIVGFPRPDNCPPSDSGAARFGLHDPAWCAGIIGARAGHTGSVGFSRRRCWCRR